MMKTQILAILYAVFVWGGTLNDALDLEDYTLVNLLEGKVFVTQPLL